jgi:hypothetical protein
VELDERERARRAGEAIADVRPRLEHCFLSHVSVRRRKVVVEFVLRQDGHVEGVTLSPKLGGPDLEDCIWRVLQSANLEPPRHGAAAIRVPLKLGVP